MIGHLSSGVIFTSVMLTFIIMFYKLFAKSVNMGLDINILFKMKGKHTYSML